MPIYKSSSGWMYKFISYLVCVRYAVENKKRLANTTKIV